VRLVSANVEQLTSKKKCFMCRHKLDGWLAPGQGVSVEFAYHMSDTHGIPYQILWGWIYNYVYGVMDFNSLTQVLSYPDE